ncbi:MAG: hypothetical protein ACRCVA_08310 [Phreatobacter sp.]
MTELASADPADALWRDAKGQPFFRHRPKLVGAEITFTLEPDALAWSDGKVEGRMPLHQIGSVRIVYRPANLYTRRFRVEINQRLGKSVWFANLSYRGLMEVETNDQPFAAFVRELLARIAKASPKALFLGGEPAWRYGLVGLFSLVLAGAGIIVGVEAVKTLTWALAGAVLVVAGYMAWQMAQWLIRNKPVVINPQDPPTALLP